MKNTILALTVGILALLMSFSRPLETMTRISGAVIYPNGLSISTTWHRVGLILARVDEEPLTFDGVTYQTRVVYQEPEIWVLDVPRLTGQHIVDPGPSFGYHQAVVAYRGDLNWKSELVGLEVGREKEFMETRGIVAMDNVYRYQDGETGFTAVLTVDDEGTPERVELLSESEVLITLVYDRYETGLPLDMELFAPPQGYQITDPKPDLD